MSYFQRHTSYPEMFGPDSCFKPIGDLALAIHNTRPGDLLLFAVTMSKLTRIKEELIRAAAPEFVRIVRECMRDGTYSNLLSMCGAMRETGASGTKMLRILCFQLHPDYGWEYFCEFFKPEPLTTALPDDSK